MVSRSNGFRIAFAVCLAGAGVPAAAQVTVAIPSPPAVLTPGAATPVTVQWNRADAEPEKRVVLLLDLVRESDGARLARGVADNSGAGFAAASGTGTVSCTAPTTFTGTARLVARAAPWSINRSIKQAMATYPADGTFTYLWSGGGYGVTRNLYYKGSLAAPKPAGNTTYCSGLAFDAFIKAHELYHGAAYPTATIGNMATAGNMETFRKVWYGVTDAEKLSARAVPEWGAGVEITDLEEAQEGDCCQFWRWSGSGHNPIFLGWLRDSGGAITGVRYWGSQGSTNGVGTNQENFGASSGVRRDRFYLARAKKPRDATDDAWTLGTATSPATTQVGTASAVDAWRGYTE